MMPMRIIRAVSGAQPSTSVATGRISAAGLGWNETAGSTPQPSEKTRMSRMPRTNDGVDARTSITICSEASTSVPLRRAVTTPIMSANGNMSARATASRMAVARAFGPISSMTGRSLASERPKSSRATPAIHSP